MSNATQLTVLLVVTAILCGFTFGYSEVIAPINEIAKAISAVKP